MTYEEMLQQVVSKLRFERELTRKGHKTRYTFNDYSFTKIRILEICKVVLKLQDDEKVLRIIEARDINSQYDPYDTILEDIDYERVDFLGVELFAEFDPWYEKYLLSQRSSVSNLDYINLLRIVDVLADINEQMQLARKPEVSIHLMYSTMRYRELFLADTIELRNQYCENRLSSLQYLKDRGIITKFTHGQNGWHTLVSITLVMSKFDSFFKEIKSELTKRNKPDSGQSPIKIESKTDDVLTWLEDFRWEGKKFVFGRYGSIDFVSDDRRDIFKKLADKKGDWTSIADLTAEKDANYVRSTIKQIEARLPSSDKIAIKIVSTLDDDTKAKPNTGAYRIKVTLPPKES